MQSIASLPQHVKDVFRTVWEIKQKSIIDMAADRGVFVDQSQSLNLFVVEPTIDKLTSMLFYGWKRGLKTGMYYLRTKPAMRAIQFSIAANMASSNTSQKSVSCAISEECLSCSA